MFRSSILPRSCRPLSNRIHFSTHTRPPNITFPDKSSLFQFTPEKHLKLPFPDLKFPTGSNAFEYQRQRKAFFMDKTHQFRTLFYDCLDPKFFIVRPRKFGKSLLVEQLKHISMGNRDIFGPLKDEHGTVINPQKFAVYDDEELFNRGNATLHLDFSALSTGNLSLSFMDQLSQAFKENGVEPYLSFPSEDKWETTDIPSHFVRTISHLAATAKHGQVDILIDEYDSKISAPLAAMEMDTHTEMQQAVKEANRMRTKFQDILGPLKSLSPKIGLLFITGVSRFPQTNLFSSLNDLSDVTFDTRYSTLFGYTFAELERIVQKDIDLQFWEDLTKQYNGYCWGETGDCTLFNPYDLNRFLNTGKWKNYWVIQGRSSRIASYLKMCYKLHNVLPVDLIDEPPLVDISDMDVIDLDKYIPEDKEQARNGLLSRLLTFGYLTRDLKKSLFNLKVPNEYVRQELLDSVKSVRTTVQNDAYPKMLQCLRNNDVTGFCRSLEPVLDGFSYEILKADEGKERVLHSLLHGIFTTFKDLDSTMIFASEISVHQGRGDMIVKFAGGPQFIFELKSTGTVDAARDQVRKKKYHHHSLIDLNMPVRIVVLLWNLKKDSKGNLQEPKLTWLDDVQQPGS